MSPSEQSTLTLAAQVRRSRGLSALAVAATLVATLAPQAASALIGTHGPAVTTFDTRASSVALASNFLSFGGNNLLAVTYNTAFSSTTGRLSSQFAAHALMLNEDGIGVGFAAGAVTMYSLSIGERFANGVPRRATNVFGGVVPTAILGTIGGRVWVPVVFGVAQSFSPVQWLTLTGYGELDPGLDFNAVVAPTALKDATQTGDALSEAQLRDLFNRAVSWNIGFGFGWRAGADITAHLGNTFDLSLRGGAGNVGTEVSWSAGLTLTARWDDFVQGVLAGSKAARTSP